MRKLILASASPRRKEILKETGLPFRVDASRCEEMIDPGMTPPVLARSLSLQKVQAVAAKYTDAIVVAADTFIVLGDTILGKPHTAREAIRMLRMLSGKAHTVTTGFTVIDTKSGKKISRSVKTKVYFRKIKPKEIQAYVKSGEPLDKAGAYAIQGKGAGFVDKIEGDFLNVVGLPLNALMKVLRIFGIGGG